jgi:hypothetical protein
VIRIKILEEDDAQGSAELILVMGGIMVIVIVAAIYYRNYIQGLGNSINNTDLNNTISNITALKNKF